MYGPHADLFRTESHILLPYHNTSAATDCVDGVWWIKHILGQCVQNNAQYAGVILAIASLLAFSIASLPQIIENCVKGKTDEAISVLLLVFWLTGDSISLTACYLVNQLPLQKYTAIYYVMLDVILWIQYIHSLIKHRWKKRTLIINEPSRRDMCAIFLLMTFSMTFVGINVIPNEPMEGARRVAGGRTLLHVIHPVLFKGWLSEVGYALGCTVTCLYIASRIPQLIKNYKRKSVEGISVLTFILIDLGNILYGLSVVLGEHGDHSNYYIRALPWIVGSFGMVLLDLIMYYHFWIYRYKRRLTVSAVSVPYSDDVEPLVDNEVIN